MKMMLLILIALSSFASAEDYSDKSTEALIQMRGSIPEKDKIDFWAEMQKRNAAMSMKEKAMLMSAMGEVSKEKNSSQQYVDIFSILCYNILIQKGDDMIPNQEEINKLEKGLALLKEENERLNLSLFENSKKINKIEVMLSEHLRKAREYLRKKGRKK